MRSATFAAGCGMLCDVNMLIALLFMNHLVLLLPGGRTLVSSSLCLVQLYFVVPVGFC